MHRRFRNIVLFLGATLGTVLLLVGVFQLAAGSRQGWIYVAGAVLAFALAFMPGKRLRDATRPME